MEQQLMRIDFAYAAYLAVYKQMSTEPHLCADAESTARSRQDAIGDRSPGPFSTDPRPSRRVDPMGFRTPSAPAADRSRADRTVTGRPGRDA